MKLRFERDLAIAAANYTVEERALMVAWYAELVDMKVSVANIMRVEPIKLDLKDWLQWFVLINNLLRRTLGIQGVPHDCLYRENKAIYPALNEATFPMKAGLLKATLVVNGSHFIKDTSLVYGNIKSTLLDTLA